MRKLSLIVLACAALLVTGNVFAAGGHEEDDDNSFSMHGEVRFRGEAWSNLMDFTDKGGLVNDDDFDIFPYRVRFGAKGDLGHGVYVYGEFQGAGVMGGGETCDAIGNCAPVRPHFGDSSEEDEINNVDLYQGWVKLKDVGDTVLDLKFGRQEIKFDRGLHFSNLPFYNGISHDGIRAAWDWDKLSIDAFWTRPSESNLGINTGDTTLDPDEGFDTDTLGLHFRHDLSGDDNEHEDVAYYVFFETQNSDAISPSDGDERGTLYTIGARWGRWVKGEDSWFWNAEAAVQTGDYSPCAPLQRNHQGSIGFSAVPSPWPQMCTGGMADRTFDQSSLVFEGTVGYVWADGDTSQKLYFGYTMASGDDDPNDRDSESYIPLYTDFHKRLGYADLWALTNISAYSVGYKASLNDHKHAFGGIYWMFEKAEEEGTTFSPLLGAGGAFIDCDPSVTPSGTTSDCEDDLGWEIDIFYNYNMTNNFSFETALSFVDPGDAVEDHISGFGTFKPNGEDTAWRLTAQARARF